MDLGQGFELGAAPGAEMTRGEMVNAKTVSRARPAIGGIAGWVMARWRRTRRNAPRLALLERIALAPRQSLALVEADGHRLLVATSADGGPAFYALDSCPSDRTTRSATRHPARISW